MKGALSELWTLYFSL
jgi:hypothetical protein